MKHGIYKGKVKHLVGEGAILRKDSDNQYNYLAQFDNRDLAEAFNWISLRTYNFTSVR